MEVGAPLGREGLEAARSNASAHRFVGGAVAAPLMDLEQLQVGQRAGAAVARAGGRRAARSPPRPGRGRRRTRPAARGRSALPSKASRTAPRRSGARRWPKQRLRPCARSATAAPSTVVTSSPPIVAGAVTGRMRVRALVPLRGMLAHGSACDGSAPRRSRRDVGRAPAARRCACAWRCVEPARAAALARPQRPEGGGQQGEEAACRPPGHRRGRSPIALAFGLSRRRACSAPSVFCCACESLRTRPCRLRAPGCASRSRASASTRRLGRVAAAALRAPWSARSSAAASRRAARNLRGRDVRRRRGQCERRPGVRRTGAARRRREGATRRRDAVAVRRGWRALRRCRRATRGGPAARQRRAPACSPAPSRRPRACGRGGAAGARARARRCSPSPLWPAREPSAARTMSSSGATCGSTRCGGSDSSPAQRSPGAAPADR